jgi:hypothetical protein
MADNREGRSREAGDRDRAVRRRTQGIIRRIERWEVPDDDRGGRPHRRSRAQLRTWRTR